MKKKRGFSLLIALFVVAAYQSGSVAVMPSAVNPVPPAGSVQEVFTYINQARSKPCRCGNQMYPAVGPLVYNQKLATAAQKHADWMASALKMSHTEPKRDVKDAGKRVTQEGYSWSVVAENIAAGQPTAREVVDAWLHSTGHCQTIMNGAVKEVGIGLSSTSSGQYHYYWAADFGTQQ